MSPRIFGFRTWQLACVFVLLCTAAALAQVIVPPQPALAQQWAGTVPPEPAEVVVSFGAGGPIPRDITVTVGTKVTWYNCWRQGVTIWSERNLYLPQLQRAQPGPTGPITTTGQMASAGVDWQAVLDPFCQSSYSHTYTNPGLYRYYNDLLPFKQAGSVTVVTDISALPYAYVTTSADELTDNGNCSLREAVQAVNTQSVVDKCNGAAGSDLIILPAGNYTLTLTGPNEDLNRTGDLDIAGRLILQAKGAAAIDGNRIDRIFDIRTNVAVTMTGVTLRNGLAGGPFQASGDSGGALFNRGTLTLQDVTLHQNAAGNAAKSGCIPSMPPNFPPPQCIVTSGGYGGAIYNVRTLVLERTVLTENTAGSTAAGNGGKGGAIYNIYEMTVHGGAMQQNKAGNGGPYELSFTASTNGLGGDGGAIANAGDAIIHGVTFTENQAGDTASCNSCFGSLGGSGGAIANSGLMTITASTFNDNRAGAAGDQSEPGRGGALVNLRSLHVTNSTFSGNSAGDAQCKLGGVTGGSGGAIFNFSETVIDSSTIVLNHAGTGASCNGAPLLHGVGGGIATPMNAYPPPVNPALQIKNTILANNTTAVNNPTSSRDCYGDVWDLGYNLILTPSGCNVYGGSGPVTTKLGVDPLLEPLADNGGPTYTHALQPGSPAIDAGSCINSIFRLITADQRGVPRPQGPACDIGAFEK